MSSSTRKTVTIPLPLGSASDYDRMMFPVLRVKGAKEKGDLYLQATLDEIIKIKDMAKNRGGYDHLLQNAKSQYDVLKKTQTKLQQRPATLNPFKLFANQRRARLFHEAGKLLYQSTRSTSDQMRRELVSYDSTNVAVSDGRDDSPDDALSGLAIQGDGDLDYEIQTLLTETASVLTDPFTDPPDPTAFDDHATLATESFITPDTASTSVGSGTQSSTGPIFNIFNINSLHHSSSTVSGVDVSSPTGSVIIQAGISEGNEPRSQSSGSSTSATLPGLHATNHII